MGRYEQIVEDACASVETSCASCGEFMAKDKLYLIPLDDDRLYSMRTPGGEVQLDNCGTIVNGSCRICITYLDALNKGNIPKFSALNAVNVIMCQHYPLELQDLTLMEEYVVARTHPIGTILKLKPYGVRNSTAYNGIQDNNR
jgi:hypothetical protein